MGKRGVRVMLASDQPEIRRYLEEVVEQRLGGTVVAEGENAVRALRLARQFRPDVAIIDSYLPYQVSLNDVALSRSAGLDAAQAISAEIPDVRVVVVDPDTSYDYPPLGKGAVLWPSLSAAARADSRPGISFASLRETEIRRKAGFSGTCFTVGIIGLLAGLVLAASMILAYIGLPLMVIGAVSLFTGCAGKLVSSLRSKRNEAVEADAGDAAAGGEGGAHDSK